MADQRTLVKHSVITFPYIAFFSNCLYFRYTRLYIITFQLLHSLLLFALRLWKYISFEVCTFQGGKINKLAIDVIFLYQLCLLSVVPTIGILFFLFVILFVCVCRVFVEAGSYRVALAGQELAFYLRDKIFLLFGDHRTTSYWTLVTCVWGFPLVPGF